MELDPTFNLETRTRSWAPGSGKRGALAARRFRTPPIVGENRRVKRRFGQHLQVDGVRHVLPQRSRHTLKEIISDMENGVNPLVNGSPFLREVCERLPWFFTPKGSMGGGPDELTKTMAQITKDIAANADPRLRRRRVAPLQVCVGFVGSRGAHASNARRLYEEDEFGSNGERERRGKKGVITRSHESEWFEGVGRGRGRVSRVEVVRLTSLRRQPT